MLRMKSGYDSFRRETVVNEEIEPRYFHCLVTVLRLLLPTTIL